MKLQTQRESRLLRPLGWALLTLALLGIVPTALLTEKSIALAAHTESVGGDVCTALGFDCTGALSSDDAKVAGIALSYLGLAWYVGLTVFLGAALVARRSGLGWPHDAWPGMTFFAAAAAAVPAVILLRRFAATSAYPLCPLCAATHAVSLSVFALATAAFILSLWRPQRHALLDLDFPGDMDAPPPPEALCAQYLMLGLVAATAAAGLALTAAQFAEVAAVHRVSVARLREIEAIPEVRNILLTHDADEITPQVLARLKAEPLPFWGTENAQTRFVMVTDFGCPACRRMHPLVKQLVADWPGEVRVDLLQFPLSTDCNTGIERDLHPHACEAHRAAIAAGSQGKMIEYVELLFAEQARFAEHPWEELAKRLDLDLERFRRDLESPETAARLKLDIDKGIALAIKGTPRFVVGNKVLPDGTTPAEAMEYALNAAP